MKKALVVIDMQNDYFKGGNMELIGINEALLHTQKVIHFAREKKYEIFYIQHSSIGNHATFFRPNTDGVRLHKDLDTTGVTIIEKHYPNSFRETTLHNALIDKGIKHLIICGAMSHMCVDTTVRAGFDLGYKIELLYDACATKDLVFKDETFKAEQIHKIFMASLDGRFCNVKCVKDL